jgi:CheY-like chemotaxis protein
MDDMTGRLEAFRKGASAYVNKPCKIDDLFEVVYKVMAEDVTFIGKRIQGE